MTLPWLVCWKQQSPSWNGQDVETESNSQLGFERAVGQMMCKQRPKKRKKITESYIFLEAQWVSGLTSQS